MFCLMNSPELRAMEVATFLNMTKSVFFMFRKEKEKRIAVVGKSLKYSGQTNIPAYFSHVALKSDSPPVVTVGKGRVKTLKSLLSSG